jgi:ubiquinol-cytochrome c reductase cytochrome b subunit
MKRLLDWLDERTGYRKLTNEALYEHIPGGARWRYVWGSTLSFCFVVQVITGFALWMAYSPSSQTAWESVFYIQHQMWGGWLLRGIHHFTAQAMIILLVLHLMQVVIDGAYKAPREVNFWTGLVLLQLVLALSLTGYLLPWDQKGFWATKVATNLLGIIPFVGADLQKLVVGGSDYGHHTLTRFFALHAGVLPAMVVALIAGHIWLFRKHGITAKRPYKKKDAYFWPDQVFMDAVACLAVAAAVLLLCVRHKLMGPHGPLGADLGAPADPSEPYSAARPEWYFLFLFQFLKYFPGPLEIWGAIIIPGVVMGVMFLMPKLADRPRGHQFNLALIAVLLAGSGWLTWAAMKQDKADPAYQLAVTEADREAHRAAELAKAPDGIPLAGAVALLRSDPLTQGPKLFSKNCASCHRYDGHDGTGRQPDGPPRAPDLKGFASREWIAGLLDPARVDSNHYFGLTKFNDGKMSKWVKKNVTGYSPEQREQLRKVIAAVSAEAGLRAQRDADARDAATIKEGAALARGDIGCTECHAFQKPDEDATAPLLTGYGSREWLVRFISNPKHGDFYGSRNDRMPAFAESQILDTQSIGILADWLRGEWYVPGRDATAAAK